MERAVGQFLGLLHQGILALLNLLKFVWAWSFGEIVKIFNSPWQNWIWWKQAILLAVVLGIVWALYKAARELWDAGEKLLTAFIGVLRVLIAVLPYVVIAGLIAFGGAQVLTRI
jgi:Na+/H+-dicarboxylate symporter